MNEVELTVDGESIKAEKGETVLSACERNGIEIPTLCEHKALTNAMACRICIVEVNGEQIEPACGLKVAKDIEIKTNTEKLEKYRKMNLELIYLNENHFCMFCESDGDCELQDLMWEHGIDHFDFPRAYPHQALDASHDFLVIDNNRCIKCGRCVRACDEVVGSQTLGFGGRGLENEIVADTDIPLAESSCIECGLCQQVCPTGAIFNKQSMFKGTTRECDSTITTCMKCSIGCGTEVYKRAGNIVEIMGTDLESDEGGQLCKMGRFEPVIDEDERIEEVIIREDGEEEKITIDEGIEKVKDRLKEADRISALASGESTSEVLDEFEGVMRGYGALVDVVGAERHRIEKEVMRRVNMIQGHLIDDISEVMEADNLLVYDTSIVETHPVLASFIRRAAINGTKLITVDTDEDKFWRHSDISISIESPNTQLTRLVNEVIKEG
ncbi:MAG: 2Fe-2S iron-sulfur cluster-binding protein, partial [Thermoplasmata archaeon]